MIGKVYKIVNDTTSDIYIGSTVQSYLCDRWKVHRSRVHDEEYKNNKLYNFMREHPYQFKIELIEEYTCGNEEEIRKHEQYWIDYNNPTLNSKRAYVADEQRVEENQLRCKQYYQKNKEEIKQRVKQYNIDHKEERTNYDKTYYRSNKDKVLQRVNEYRKNHQSEIRNRIKINYEQNKDEILSKRKIDIVTCDDCKCDVRKDCYPRHLRSKKHLQKIADVNKVEITFSDSDDECELK